MTELGKSRPPVVGVIGAGLMGHGIAQVFMSAGSPVRIWDPDPRVLETVPDRIRGHLRMIGSSADVNLVLGTSVADAVADVDLVVEAIPENLQMKRALVAELDRLAPSAIVATNTSVIRISEIAARSAKPERVVGAHWWNPPYLIPIVEVVRAEQTHDDVMDTMVAWLRAAGKTPVVVNRDVPGFIGNRMQFALWREALSIVEQGICDAETVDMVARQTFGLRLEAIGPLEHADFIGLDLTAAIMDYLTPYLSNEVGAPALIRAAIQAQDVGAKSGRGILEWPVGKRAATEQRLLSHLIASVGQEQGSDSGREVGSSGHGNEMTTAPLT